jgi:hypothetical protein
MSWVGPDRFSGSSEMSGVRASTCLVRSTVPAASQLQSRVLPPLSGTAGTHLGAWFTVHGGAYALRPFAPRLAGYRRPPEEPRCE